MSLDVPSKPRILCPNTVVFQEGDPDFEGAPVSMRFRLVYEGQLLGATQSSTRSEHKHEIRRAFHPQLKRVWDDNPHLRGVHNGRGYTDEEHYDFHPNNLAKRFTAGNYNYVPLVMEDDRAMVDINVLLLRPGPLGVIGPSGDIDNRLATLFDALQVPPIGSNLGKKYETPLEDEKPFYCFVSNDKLISKVTVEADVLLGDIYRRDKEALQRDRNDVVVIITAEIRNLVSSSLFLNRF